MDAYALAANKMRQLYSGSVSRSAVEAEFGKISSHNKMWRVAHALAANDLQRLLELPTERRLETAKRLMRVKVEGQSNLDDSILQVLEDFSDGLLNDKLEKATWQIHPSW